MKDGSYITRYYHAPEARLIGLTLRLDETATARLMLERLLKGQYVSTQERGPGTEYLSGKITLVPSFAIEGVNLDLNQEKRSRLLGCITDDILAQSTHERYFPDRPEVCTLRFTATWSEVIYVTESFTKTLAFLRDNGCLPAVANREIEYVNILDYTWLIKNSGKLGISFNPLFASMTVAVGSLDGFKRQSFIQPYTVTEAHSIGEVLAHSHMQYFTADDGFIVLIKFRGDDKLTTAFLPAKDAPDYVTKALK